MNPQSATTLWSRLRDAGLVTGEMPASSSDTPWYLAALVGVSAWIAALLLFGFFAALFNELWRNGGTALVLGVLCCAGALVLLRVARGGEFLGQGAIALSLAGQILIGVALHDLVDDSLAWCGLGAVALVLYALGATPMHRFLCGAVFAAALVGLCADLDDSWLLLPLPLLAWLAGALWWRGERQDALAPQLSPLAWALSLAALLMAWFGGGGELGLHRAVDPGWRLGAQLATVALLPTTAALLLQPWRAASGRTHGALLVLGALALALLWLRAPGIAFGLMLALIGFAVSRPALLVAGLAGVGVYLLRYYYQLEVPLLQKAQWLALSGAALLLARFVYLRRTGRPA